MRVGSKRLTAAKSNANRLATRIKSDDAAPVEAIRAHVDAVDQDGAVV
jgi:hypothetical protein